MFDVIGKIGIWGDSVLRGIIYDEKKNKYTTLEENSASLISRDMGLDIKNNSRFGCTAPKALRLLEASLAKGFDCEVAIIELGGNDCDYNWEEVAANPDEDHQPNTPLDVFRSSITEMVNKVREKNIVPILVNLPPLDPERYFSWITKSGLDGSKILSWLGDVQRIYRHHERYSLAIMNLARTLNCHMIDIRDAFLKEPDYRRYLCLDGIHPNSEGHKLMERAFREYAKQYISE